ncbi:hypothetical protein [Nocardia asteroides]
MTERDLGPLVGSPPSRGVDTAPGSDARGESNAGFSTCFPDCVEHSYSSMEFGCFGVSSVLGRRSVCADAPVTDPAGG